MRALQTSGFKRSTKRLRSTQKVELDPAVRAILANPELGDMKKGDLASVRVHKFCMNKALVLLAYSVGADVITLMALGAHENFYRDLKRG